MQTRTSILVQGFGLTLIGILGLPNQALADWGEDTWGTMVWGVSAPAVPSLPAVGLFVLALALLTTAAWRLRARKALHSALAILVVPMLAGVLSSPAHAQGVTVPNTFVNGEVADADEVNANFTAITDALDVTVPNSFANSGIADANEVNTNFDALKTAVDTFTNDLAAATAATDTAFSNGATSVDITTDNQASYDSGVASVDITTDNQTVCEAAGGTWDAGTSTCTEASNYNCFVGGFCAQAALDFPPATNGGYTNVYDGHTKGTEPALGAGCNTFPGSNNWANGLLLSSEILPNYPTSSYPGSIHFSMCRND